MLPGRRPVAPTAAGHGLVPLPSSLAEQAHGAVAVPARAPRPVHRVEMVHGGAPRGPVGRLVAMLDPAGGGGAGG